MLTAATLVPLGGLVAQDDCFPADDSNEARTFGIVSVPLAFTGAGGLQAGRDGVTLGVEGAWLPRVPDRLATPTACRPGKGPENANPLPGFARVRLAVTFAGWQLEAGWIPPVRVEGVRANLVGVAIGRELSVGRRWVARPRLHALLGALRAPITCDDEALTDPASECFGGTRSNDRWQPGVFGAEVAVARRAARWIPHVGIGYSHLRPRFQVDFTNAQGSTDRRRVSVDLHRLAVFGGVTYGNGAWSLTTEAYATLGDRITGRAVVRHRLGGP